MIIKHTHFNGQQLNEINKIKHHQLRVLTQSNNTKLNHTANVIRMECAEHGEIKIYCKLNIDKKTHKEKHVVNTNENSCYVTHTLIKRLPK